MVIERHAAVTSVAAAMMTRSTQELSAAMSAASVAAYIWDGMLKFRCNMQLELARRAADC